MRNPTRVLQVLFFSAVAVSIVHYVDNVVRFDDYDPDPGLITAPVVAVSWFVFTAFGLWGYVQYRRGHRRAAALALAVYSGSGLIGPVHYTVVSPSDLDGFQNLFVVLDTVLGLGVLAFACWLALTPADDGSRTEPMVASS